MKKVIILFALITTILAGYQHYNPNIVWQANDYGRYAGESNKRIPFPQCLVSGSKSDYLKSSSFQALFNRKLQKELETLNTERHANSKQQNTGYMGDSGKESEKDDAKSLSAATAAIKMTRDIMTILACDLNGTDTQNLNKFLNKFSMPQELCSYNEKPSCDGKRKFRTANGLCNNNEYPYRGSSQTAFGRILDADYDDNLGEPRRKSQRGGLLPPCRKISLALGSKPVFDRNFNNLFVIFGQYIANDMALSTPATDTNLTPTSTCRCDSKYDWDKCTVIDVQADDPYLRGQKCMAFPATAQAYKDQICTLGIKEQMNGNTHFVDLSTLYGSTLRTALALRSDNGLMKSKKVRALKYELPPAQQEGKSCADGTRKQPCFAGGDSRLMDNLLFTGINTMFLRLHNQVAKKVAANIGDTNPHRVYEIAKQFTSDLYQGIVFGYWIPKLLGPEYSDRLLNSLTTTGYNKDVAPVVYNEVTTAAFRLHTLVRDIFSRCTSKGKRIDQLGLHDISHKAKYAYDFENNGIDSILCGSFYDFGFAHDGHFAGEIHHRLFESKTQHGHLWRNDLIAINICRGREHGIRSYNSYREYCNFTKANYFEDFRDTINYDGIKQLKQLYKHPNDVDLFVGLNLEDPVQGGIVGPVSACLLAQQFRVLCEGDRFCVTHRYGLTKGELQKLSWVGLVYLTCQTVDIESVPLFPFRPPNEINNPMVNCSIFADMDNDFAAKVVSLVENPISSTNKFTASIFNVALEQFLLKPGFYDYYST